MMKKILYIVAFLFFGNLLMAQEFDYIKTNSARESLKIAQGFINKNNFKRAKKQLKYTIKIKEDFPVAYRELGRVHYELEEYAEATIAFEKSFDANTKISRAAYFECGEAYFKSNDIERAMYYYKVYEEMKDEKYINKKKESGLELDYDKIIAQRKKNLEYVLKLPKDSPYAFAKNLGKDINTEADEYLPTVISSGKRVVFTRKHKHADEDIFVSSIDEELGTWKKARKIGYDINTKKNEGMAKFATHGKTFFFAGCERADSEGGCDVYEAELEDGEVSQINRIEGLNSHYWDSQPSISCDGNTMFFSSSRPGGLGGADIWMSKRLANGDWGNAVNMGKSINTPYDEEAPYIATDGKTLYFTSDGHEGQGDGDIFISRYDDKFEMWSKAQNMGLPFNSPSKELGIYIKGDGEMGYFASARYGGEGGLDLYYTKLPPQYRPIPMIHVEGKIVDKQTSEPIATKFQIYRTGKKWLLESDEEGWFFACLEGNKGYSFQVEVPGYDYFLSAVFLPPSDNEEPTPVLISLKPEGYQDAVVHKTAPIEPKPKPKPVPEMNIQRGAPTLANSKTTLDTGPKRTRVRSVLVYFDFNSFDLNTLAIKELKKVSMTLAKDPAWKVEVIGFADNVGDADYNKKLSEKRAQEVVNYLKKLGVTIENVVRQEGKGSLEGQTEEEKKMSRRVEVVMTKQE